MIVTFDFRKDGRIGFGPAPKAGRIGAAGWDHLHVSTARNDWFLNADTMAVAAEMAKLVARYGHVSVLGYSMGGYGALRFARALRADWAVVVSPFLSILPDRAPWETRHQEDRPYWQAAGDRAEIPALDHLNGLLVVDPLIEADDRQARAIAELAPMLQRIDLVGGGHPATKAQREAGQGAAALAAAMGQDPDGAGLRAAQVFATGPIDGSPDSV